MMPIFTAAPLAIQIHIIAALLALVIGPFVIWRNRRDRLHKSLGYTWVLAMATVAISSFFITENGVIGPFSPIHGLSVWTLYVLWVGVNHARKGNIAAHKGELKSLFVWGMGIAGTLTLLPGRRINGMLFGENELLGLYAIGAMAALAAILILREKFGHFSLVKRGELR